MKSFRPTVALFVLLILGLCYTKSSQAQGENKPELTLEQRLEYSGVAVREEGWQLETLSAPFSSVRWRTGH